METTIKALESLAKAARENAKWLNECADSNRASAKQRQAEADAAMAEAAEYEQAIDVLKAVENLRAGRPGNSEGTIMTQADMAHPVYGAVRYKGQLYNKHEKGAPRPAELDCERVECLVTSENGRVWTTSGEAKSLAWGDTGGNCWISAYRMIP